MEQDLIEELERRFKDRSLLTVEDVTAFLGCKPQLVYNWTRIKDPAKRPPRIKVGPVVKFPKTGLARWLARERAEK